MSVSSLTARNDYVGNGAANAFDFDFSIFAASHIQVIVTDEDGVDTTLVLDTDYSVPTTDIGTANGGTITLIDADQDWLDASGDLDTGWTITLLRNVPLLQPTDIRNGGEQYPETLEVAFDRGVQIDQQQQEEIDRTLKLPTSEEGSSAATTLPLAADRASMFLAFDADGDPIAATTVTTSPVTAAAATILDDTTIGAIRATLGTNGWGGTVGGTADAITLTPSPAYAAYVSGDAFAFVATGTNTGAATVAISGLGTKSIKNLAGSALAAGEITSGRLYVMRYDGTNFRLHDINALGTGTVTALSLAASSLGFSMVNGTLTAAVGSNALTIAIKTKAGTDPSATDPVYILFRNATVATGDYTVITVSAATSVVVSSGSTLAATNATAFRVWVVGFNDGGTFRLGVINCLSGTNIYPLGQFPIASSTAEGGAGAADSAHVFYTGSAVTSKPYAILGYASFESGLTTAGTWDAVPTRLHLHRMGDPLPGVTLQSARSSLGTVATGTTAIPYDDTIPQITEGDQYITQAITPSSAANLLRVMGQLIFGHSTDDRANALALFRDATANALAVSTHFGAGSTTEAPGACRIDHDVLAGAASATTLRLRAGSITGATTSVNGEAGAQKYGGVYNSYLKVEEVMA